LNAPRLTTSVRPLDHEISHDFRFCSGDVDVDRLQQDEGKFDAGSIEQMRGPWLTDDQNERPDCVWTDSSERLGQSFAYGEQQ
jgi:hypothetical protein